MTLNVSIAKINNPTNSAKGTGNFRGLQKDGQGNSAQTFCGAPIELKNEKIIGKINWLGDDFTSAGQRFVSGITALFTQPFFDLNNKKADDDTRTISCARTLGKIVAGTTTGVLIRWGCVEATKKFCKTEATEQVRIEKLEAKAKKSGKTITEKAKTQSEFSKREQFLLPKGYESKSFREIKKYRGAFGTFAAVLIMVVTNFAIDAPLTTYLTNKFSNMLGKDPAAIEGGKK